EPSTRRTTGNGFRDRRIRPLCHPSGRGIVAAAAPLPGRGRERGLAAAVLRGGDDLLRGEQHRSAGSRPNSVSAAGSCACGVISIECDQAPTNAVTGARGFSARIRANSLPDWSVWSVTMRSLTLHQSSSGTHDAAISRAYVYGLRSA